MSKAMIVIKLLSTIITVIQTVEERSNEAKAKGEEVFTGQFKQELAISTLREVYSGFGFDVPFDNIVESVKSTINVLVAAFNAIGRFKKG